MQNSRKVKKINGKYYIMSNMPYQHMNYKKCIHVHAI